MLADVVKEREKIEQQKLDEENAKYNKSYKRDTIVYFDSLNVIGVIETWIYNLVQDYELSVLYNKSHPLQLEKLHNMGIETIKYIGQPIECDTLLFCLFGDASKLKAKKRHLFIHGIYKTKEEVGELPEYDEIYAVSKTARDYFYKATGIKPKVLYNPVKVMETTKPLVFGVFSRLSSEKGRYRLIDFVDRLIDSNKPFLMLIFTDLPFECDDSRVIFINPVDNISGWVKVCDYVVQLSDTEAACLTMQEALKLKKPLIVTKLEPLEEFEINESNSKILEMDLSNLDIDDLWNIPIVKDWHEPISKEWEDIMKKKVFREKHKVEEQPKEEPKKEKKVKKNDRNTDSKWA